MEDLAANVRPEFLEFVGETVPKDRKAKREGASRCGVVFCGMRHIGDGGHGVAERL